jgi:glycosyltransferase involved in cell wall biosynthesis
VTPTVRPRVDAGPASVRTRLGASVLIRTRNEARLIGECLAAVLSQDGVDVEVIVLDSGSTDGTVDIARRFPVCLMTIPAEHFSYGYSLNVGFEAAEHAYLVALSGHAIPLSQRWLARLLSHFQDPRVAGVSGPEVNRWNPPPPPGVVQLRRETFFDRPGGGFSNFNSAIRRAAWEMVPYHEGLSYGEDKEWAWRLVERGAAILVDNEAAVQHEHLEALGDVWRRARREALGQAAWRGPRRYRLLTALRLALVTAADNFRRGRRDVAGVLGPLACYHGRYTGFAEARRHLVDPGPRLLRQPRGLPKLRMDGAA